MAKNDFIKVSRRQARRVLELYTLQGYTQQQIGPMVFPSSMERKVDRGVLARRVLHQFGLNMNSRHNFAQVGLTSRALDSIMDNPFIIYPLLIPVSGDPIPYISFEAELQQQLNGTGRYSKVRGWFLNLVALAIIIGLQYLATEYNHSGIVAVLPFIAISGLSLFFSSLDDDRQQKARGLTVIVLLITAVIVFFIYRIAV